MSTSDSPKIQASAALPYSEHDKLGPFGGKGSALHDPIELRARLIGEFASAVHSARDAAQSIDQGSAVAVHESRKALRRARGVLVMIGGALPKSERRAVKAALQEARRSLSTVRDHTVAPETLGRLELSDDDRGTAKRVLDNAAEAIPSLGEIKQLLGEAAARAAAQAEALQAALPAELTWNDVLDGIRTSYDDARHARRSAKRSRPWFHSWRRRSKELAFTLDFVAKHAGPRAAAIHEEIDGITDLLGPAVDLVMLREFVETHAQGIPADAIDHLRASIDLHLDDLMSISRKESRDAFRIKPKKFERRLAKCVKRDLTPPDDQVNGEHT
jgi:CHAD domain-containing protein